MNSEMRNHAALRAGTERALLKVLLPVAIAGCMDAATALAPAEPAASAVTAKVPGGRAVAAVAIEDAITRLLPALEDGGSTAVLQDGLSQLYTQLSVKGPGLGRALNEVKKALAEYQTQAGAEYQPDADAMGLALQALEETQ